MYALTIREPWATAIVRLGKDIENRSWLPRSPLIVQRIAIHASVAVGKTARSETYEAFAWIQARFPGLGLTAADFEALQANAGRIVGTACLDRAVTTSRSPWFFGPVGHAFRDPLAFDKPIGPVRGELGYWFIHPDVAEEVFNAEWALLQFTRASDPMQNPGGQS